MISGSRRQRRLALFSALALSLTFAIPAGAHNDHKPKPKPGFKTSQDAMLMLGAGAPAGSSIEALLTVGDSVNGFTYEAIPDGISVRAGHKGQLEVYVNHETSTVPFPYNAVPTVANSQNDFDNSQVSKLALSTSTAGILKGSFAIDADGGYQRFCSNFLGSRAEGFNRPVVFTNEEGIDWVNRAGTSWPATEGAASARQIGVVVAYDVNTGKSSPIWGMGRLNHENSVALPGYGRPVLLTGDDAFVSNPAQSQVYSYIAKDANAVLKDRGDLWAFVSDDPSVNDYYDFAVGSTASVSGKFIKVPKAIATGRNQDGTDMMAADVPMSLGGPYPAPPADGSWQRPPATSSGPGIDGPQWVLEHWSDVHNVFQFIRIEDVATDKRPGKSNVVYLADSGRGATSPGFANGVDGELNPFTSSNGRIWKMVMDRRNPTVVKSLSVLIDGDDNPVKTLGEIHQPDNLETTTKGLYIQEDPGSSQQFNVDQQGDANATTARIWQYKYAGAGGDLSVVASVNQALDEGSTDKDPSTTAGNWGAWESTGIIDVSSTYGPGAFLVNIQAHTLWIEVGNGPDLVGPDGPDWLNKREGGQLLLLRIKGG